MLPNNGKVNDLESADRTVPTPASTIAFIQRVSVPPHMSSLGKICSETVKLDRIKTNILDRLFRVQLELQRAKIYQVSTFNPIVPDDRCYTSHSLFNQSKRIRYCWKLLTLLRSRIPQVEKHSHIDQVAQTSNHIRVSLLAIGKFEIVVISSAPLEFFYHNRTTQPRIASTTVTIDEFLKIVSNHAVIDISYIPDGKE